MINFIGMTFAISTLALPILVQGLIVLLTKPHPVILALKEINNIFIFLWKGKHKNTIYTNVDYEHIAPKIWWDKPFRISEKYSNIHCLFHNS